MAVQLERWAPMVNRVLGGASLAGYVASIYMANWLLVHVGFVTVWPGISAPAGVYAAGFALTFRDLTQTTLGRKWVVAAILAGAALSYTVSVTFATASALAFLASETADFAVFTPLEKRHWLGAIAASNTVGLLVDSMLFLWLAFGSLAFLKGQVIGKTEATIVAVIVLALIRCAWRAQKHPEWCWCPVCNPGYAAFSAAAPIEEVKRASSSDQITPRDR